MSVKTITKAKHIRGEIQTPGDKSISHRAIMLGSLAKGTTEITGLLQSADCRSTIDCFQKLGVSITSSGDTILVEGQGLRGLKPQKKALSSSGILSLDAGNSGTTTRLMTGILSGQSFPSILTGDSSLCTRPMERIMTPLNLMGASVTSMNHNGCAPLHIQPGALHGIHYISPVPSAQVKSAILLAGLYADGETSVTEPSLSRNHTELMLTSLGANVTSVSNENGTATSAIQPCRELYAQQITVPGDISSAAYFIAAALLVPGSELLVKNVGLNPTRNGFIRVIRDMGADLTLVNESFRHGEPRGDFLVKSSSLKGTVIEGPIIPTLIDELPILAVLGAYAAGTTVISDAAELKVKESDRIAATTGGLRAMGASVTPTEDGMIIEGGAALHGAEIESFLDHRIAMSFSVAGLACDGETRIRDSECVDISYPDFYDTLASVTES